MIIHGGKKYIHTDFSSEAELEQVVVDNSELIFGPDSIFLPKKLIRSGEGIGTVPDGFALDLQERRWYVVEAELASHSVWSHIAPQVAKQIIAASQPATRRILTELVVQQLKDDTAVRARFADHDIEEIDIRRVLSEIFEQPPIIGLPIDRVGQDLREWAQTLKSEVKLWTIRKLVEFNNPNNVLYEIPDDFRPDLDTSDPESESRGYTTYDVTIADLIDAGALSSDEVLVMSYKPRDGDRKSYEAAVEADGSLRVSLASDSRAQAMLRYSAYRMLEATAPPSTDGRAGVRALARPSQSFGPNISHDAPRLQAKASAHAAQRRSVRGT